MTREQAAELIVDLTGDEKKKLYAVLQEMLKEKRERSCKEGG